MNDDVERIRERVDIVDVIGKRIPLKRQGKRFVGLCPFHNDKNPSLTVSAEKQIYKCFSCNAGGDVFKFLMEYEHKTFPDVLKELGKTTGVEVGASWSGSHSIDKNLRPKAINQWAKNLYHRYLLDHKDAKKGRDYIRSRGISKGMVKSFELGYAPEAWNFMAPHLLKKFPKEEVVRSGLVGLNRSGDCYDTFRGRIVFPIMNERQEVIGFGGRATDPSEQAKYLNTKELPFFQKRQVLYGLSSAYNQIVREGSAVVVEGYLDVMACQSVGVAAVAPLGTALTRDHLRKLGRYVNRVLLVFDGDDAGRRASTASCVQLLSTGMVGHVAFLPKGSDPFEFIRRNGKEAFAMRLEKTKTDLETFLVRGALSQHLPSQARASDGEAFLKAAASLPGNQKRHVVEELRRLVAPVSDPIIRKAFFAKVASMVGIDLQDLSTSAPVRRSTRRSSSPSPNPTQAGRERRLVLFLCAHPGFIANALAIIRPESLIDPFSKWVYEKLIRIRGKGMSFSGVLEHLGDRKACDYIQTQLIKQEAYGLPSGSSPSEEEPKHNEDNLFADYLYAVRKGQLEQATDLVSKAISQYTLDGDEARLNSAIEEKIRLVRERNNLQNYQQGSD